ncbi:MAG: fibronectin type III domain-containing protein [Patescibacteria group bacterium]
MSRPVASALLFFATIFAFFPLPALAVTCGFGSDIGGGQCRGVITTTGLNTFSVPSDWNNSSNSIEIIGGGGGGATGTTGGAGGAGKAGGGGGAYVLKSNVSLTPSTTAYLQVGAGGGTGANGTDTWFDDINWALQSNAMTTAPWSNSLVNVTLNASLSPSGSTDAASIANNATGGTHDIFQQFTVFQNYTGSRTITAQVWFKANTTNYAFINFQTAVNNYFSVVVDLTNGTVTETKVPTGGGSSGSIVSTTVTADSGGYWVAMTGTVTVSAAGNYICFGPMPQSSGNAWTTGGENNFTATNNQYSIYAYGASVYFGSVTKAYTQTTTAALYSALTKAGSAGVANTGGSGGAAASGIPATGNNGGTGANGGGNAAPGGGGGGAAGGTGVGGNGSGATGGTGDGGTTAAGANGTEWSVSPAYGSGGGGAGGAVTTGSDGGTYGAGGGGGRSASGAGGAGKQGIAVITYTPANNPPTVTSNAADTVTTTSANINGNITSIGSANATARGFATSTASDLSSSVSTSTSSGSFGTGAFSSIFSNSNLVGNTTYYFRAFATNTGGTSFGSILNFLTLPDTPAAPTFSLVAATSSTITWSAPTGGASTYKLQYCVNNTTTCTLSTGLAGLSTTTNPSLTGNTTYSAAVQGTNATGDGAFSASTTQLTLPDIPGTPTFSSVTETTMRVNWAAPTGDAATYKVERCTGSGCTGFVEIASGVATAFYDDSSLSSATTYRYRVRGTNTTGDGLYSTPAEQATNAAAGGGAATRIIRLLGGTRLLGGVRLQ